MYKIFKAQFTFKVKFFWQTIIFLIPREYSVILFTNNKYNNDDNNFIHYNFYIIEIIIIYIIYIIYILYFIYIYIYIYLFIYLYIYIWFSAGPLGKSKLKIYKSKVLCEFFILRSFQLFLECSLKQLQQLFKNLPTSICQKGEIS